MVAYSVQTRQDESEVQFASRRTDVSQGILVLYSFCSFLFLSLHSAYTTDFTEKGNDALFALNLPQNITRTDLKLG